MKKKYKNKLLWVSVFALIPLVCSAFKIEIVPNNYETLTNTIITILILLGIINNPEK